MPHARTPFAEGTTRSPPPPAGDAGRARRASSTGGRVARVRPTRWRLRRAGPDGPDKHAIRIGSEESGCASRRGRSSPAHPWAVRASRAPRPPIMEGQVPPASPNLTPPGRHAWGSTDGAVSATSLSPPCPRPQSLSRYARTEGSASTAVAPYTRSVQGVPDHFLGFSTPRPSAFSAGPKKIGHTPGSHRRRALDFSNPNCLVQRAASALRELLPSASGHVPIDEARAAPALPRCQRVSPAGVPAAPRPAVP